MNIDLLNIMKVKLSNTSEIVAIVTTPLMSTLTTESIPMAMVPTITTAMFVPLYG